MITDQLAAADGPVIPAGHAPLRRQWLPKACTIAADCAAILVATGLAMVLATLARGRVLDAEIEHVRLTVLSLPLWVVMFLRYGLYSTREIATRLDEFRRIVHAVAASVLALAAIGFLFRLWVARSWLLLFFVTAVGVVSAERQLVRAVFADLRRGGRLLRRAVVVGANAEGLALSALLTSDPALGYQVVGFVDDTADPGTYLLDHKPVLGPVHETLEAIRRSQATCAIVATSAVDLDVTNRLARQLNDAGYYVELSLSLRDIASERVTVRGVGHFHVASLGPVRRSGWRGAAKRVLDLVGAAAGLLLAAPVLLLIALAIKLESSGPVIFRQQRVGQHGQLFQMLKFRTMVQNAEELMAELVRQNEVDGPLFKIRNDPRVTRTGRFLRRFSLDEVPQLWNVLRGEMSLVGPRPALPAEVTGWSSELHQRLTVKPGITGIWQVNGRSDASFEDYVRLDLYYVDNWSLLTDLAIVSRTVTAVLRRQGAY